MIAQYTTQLATELLVSGLVSLLAITILATILALLFVRQRDPEGRLPSKIAHPESSARGYQPSVFEHSCRWLAVKKAHVKTVQAALGLHNPVPCSWDEATSGLPSRKLFISPPVRGWILVIGPGLPDPAEDIDRCFHFVVRVSRALGHVQFYCANRALNHHTWVRAEGGQIRRAYSWTGETTWCQGPLTSAEQELGLKCLEYGERPSELDFSSGPPQPTNAERIMQLAARWSLDPSTIEESRLHLGLGVVGEVAQSRPC